MTSPTRPARSAFLTAMLALALVASGCAADDEGDDATGESADEIRVTSSFTSKSSSYYPDSSALEGGFVDRRGARLRTLQQFLAGDAEYVSVAMDTNAFRYGQRLRIREVNAKYGREVIFRVVDTGGAFRNKGRARIDVCTANERASLDPMLNLMIHIDVIDES